MTKEQGVERASVFKLIRWAIAIGGLLTFVVLLLGNRFEVCKVESGAGKDGATVTTTCGGPTVTDASVVAVGLLLVLLLAPDMSEVGVLGVSLKRRLEAAEQKATDSEAKADRLESQLQMQNLRVDTISQNFAAAQATNQVFVVTSDAIKQADTRLPDKIDAFSRGEALTPNTVVPSDPSVGTDTPDPFLVSRILENWEILNASLNLQPRGHGVGGDRFRVNLSSDEIELFRSTFDEEIRIVRAMRNNVAHAVPIPNEDLQRVVDISEQLLRFLRSTPR
ncbi:hypothetical protein [Mycobacterium numidiamassiliense]|uniref:hypothetical protein n=1 Tax=Mycobacterium numidiamassiliense TaxID=1841861 RepID=UPI0010566DAF|nr:hypothetical protein [Mycobacterium numidiamassiliense]